MIRLLTAHVLLLAGATLAAETPETAIPDTETLEKSAVIGRVILDKRNIFNLDDPKEDKWLYRWANRLHIVTRDGVIQQQLLFDTGDAFSASALQESERILRDNRYLWDVDIRPVAYEDGVVDVAVTTRDVWSLTPDLSVSRSGGENRTGFGIEETNLFGRGQLLRLKRVDNVDRSSTRLDFEDRNLGRSWVSMFFRLADNDDGHSNHVSIVRPFHKLDARWAAGGSGFDDDRRTALYVLGEEAAEYRHERQYVNVFGGWSGGLDNGWVRRWSAGVVYDDNDFGDAREPTLPAVIPEDRKLVYPYVAFELLEDSFDTSSNTNQIGRTEDFYMGKRFSASVGWSDESLGANRNALLYSASASRGFGSLRRTSLFFSASASGRIESGNTTNAVAGLDIRFYRRKSEKQLFFMTLAGTAGHDLDLDNPVQLGGKSGLRGYPLRYQGGDSKLLFTIEQRYFTDWYPWRLFRVGGAIFADVGRTWGENPLDERNFGWLKNVGFGFRFAPTRFSARKTAHLDFAFPLDGDPSIDSVQVVLEAKRSF